MNTHEIRGDSNTTENNLKQKWATFRDDDIQYVKGRHDEWFDRLQKRTGETREAIEKAIKGVFSPGNY